MKYSISKAVDVLKQGGVVIYPTETCYGLGADATNPFAIRKVYKIKKRPFDKSISVIVSSKEMIKDYACLNPHAEELMDRYMPGPLTLIVKNKVFPDILCGDMVAFRISSHPVARKLVCSFGKPITATSANISGGPNPYDCPDLKGVDYKICVGKLKETPPSTIYDTINKKVIRQGPIII